MTDKLKICQCPIPNCGKSVDITNWDGVDPMICMCCCEQFDIEEVDKATIKWIDKNRRNNELKKKSVGL